MPGNDSSSNNPLNTSDRDNFFRLSVSRRGNCVALIEVHRVERFVRWEITESIVSVNVFLFHLNVSILWTRIFKCLILFRHFLNILVKKFFNCYSRNDKIGELENREWILRRVDMYIYFYSNRNRIIVSN